VNINLCVKLVVPFFANIQRVNMWLFNKSDDVGFMFWWFIYVAMEQSIVPPQGRFYIFVIFAIRCVPITAVRHRRIQGGSKKPGPPTKEGPHHVHVFSHLYDMCVPFSHFC